MGDHYSARITHYIEVEWLPLWVEPVARGGHLDRMFHDHDFSEIVLILSGEAKHLVGKSSCVVKAGDVLVMHPGYSHAYDESGSMELVNVVYDPEKLSLPILDGYSLPLFRIFFPVEPISEQTMVKPVMSLDKAATGEIKGRVKLLENELKNAMPGNFFISIALFMEIIGLLARHGTSPGEEHRARFLIGGVISFINKNFQKDISVESMVRMSRVSRRNFFRIFRSTTGCSPQEYVRKIRLQRASELLLGTNLTINEIAAQCGFYNSNYLCLIFREELGTTPRSYRLDNGRGKQSRS